MFSELIGEMTTAPPLSAAEFASPCRYPRRPGPRRATFGASPRRWHPGACHAGSPPALPAHRRGVVHGVDHDGHVVEVSTLQSAWPSSLPSAAVADHDPGEQRPSPRRGVLRLPSRLPGPSRRGGARPAQPPAELVATPGRPPAMLRRTDSSRSASPGVRPQLGR